MEIKMHTRRIGRLAALLMICLLYGCVQVQELDPPHAATTSEAGETAAPVLAARQEHDVQILAVNVTWPDSVQDLRQVQVQLAVAIENRGNETAQDLELDIILRDDAKQVVTRHVEKVTELAPGEVVVPTIQSTLSPPYSASYDLMIALEPVPGETQLANNRKRFEIHIEP